MSQSKVDHESASTAVAVRDSGSGFCSPSLDQLATEIRNINHGNGWNVLRSEEWGDVYKIPGVIALIHSEASEALEAFRKDDRENFLEELADVLIRTLDCAGGLTVEFSAIVERKLTRNRARGYRHGDKRV